MKTPKRQYESWEAHIIKARPLLDERRIKLSRWKRKNRTTQLKRTIARLTQELQHERESRRGMTNNFKKHSPEWEALEILARLKTPEEKATPKTHFLYWMNLRSVIKLVLDAACLAASDYGVAIEKKEAACHSENAENAKQGKLIYIGAEQLTARKGEA